MRYVLPYIPRSMNKYAGRKNVWEYREEKQKVGYLVKAACHPAPTRPIEKARVTLEYYFPNYARHDPDNYAGKAILDGLVRAGIIQDDDFNHIELAIKKGGVDKVRPRVEIEVEEIG